MIHAFDLERQIHQKYTFSRLSRVLQNIYDDVLAAFTRQLFLQIKSITL